jgi:hypothetical protein
LKEQIPNKLWLFRLGHLAGIFSKMSKGSLSVKGKQLRRLVANDKVELLSKKKKKSELKKYVICLLNLTASQYQKTFLM